MTLRANHWFRIFYPMSANRTKYLKGECQHCQGHIEFAAEATGLTTDCPHCGQATELMIPVPEIEPTLPRKTIIWTLVAVLVLALGLGGALVALKRARRMVEKQASEKHSTANVVPNASSISMPAHDVASEADFRGGDLKIDKGAGNGLIYASGTLVNLKSEVRFGVRVELELRDQAGQKVGTASDYVDSIESKARWGFHALVLDSRAKTATTVKISAVKEQK